MKTRGKLALELGHNALNRLEQDLGYLGNSMTGWEKVDVIRTNERCIQIGQDVCGVYQCVLVQTARVPHLVRALRPVLKELGYSITKEKRSDEV